MSDNKKKLEDIRADIEAVDREFVQLLAKRMQAVREVGELKADSDSAIWDPAREARLLESWRQEADEAGLSSHFAGRVLREILRYSRRSQEAALAQDGAQKGNTRLRVGYQGIALCNSDLAAKKMFEIRQMPFETTGFTAFEDVLDALEHGSIDYAFLPVENTIIGGIAEVNRLLTQRRISIVGEETWQVEHVLAAIGGSEIGDIREVRSHPAALAQCARFLRGMGQVIARPAIDTSGSAAELAKSGEKDVAVLCPAEAAEKYALKVLHSDVADSHNNMTRFLLLASRPEASDASLPSKTSIVVHAAHRPGALFRALSCFARSEVNLCRIESRPEPDSPWEYVFLIDLEGHSDDATVAAAIAAARPHFNQFKILGSYPSRTTDVPHISVVPAREDKETVKSTIHVADDLAGPPLAKHREDGERSTVTVGDVTIGGDEFIFIAGPCAVENKEQIFAAARMVKERGASILRGGAFKPRSSVYSFQGLGYEGLDLLRAAGDHVEMPVVTEVLTPDAVEKIAQSASMMQVGARNMQNFELLKELGQCHRPVLLKRGMSATVGELLDAAEYIMAGGNNQVVLCERGIRTFETATRNTLDVSAIPVLKSRSHLPVIVDPSHAAGRRDIVLPLAYAAAAAGADGLIVEVHPNPEVALCDKEQALTGDLFAELVRSVRRVRAAVRE
ncbi:MAG: 3-deoxy-7-phosphoheptulonate synthase/chorismate mutase-like protein [Planctomycetota bacterium]|jgi:3-deoxy-7-phosphoheptulonate synthase/chorismate mutase-like protein